MRTVHFLTILLVVALFSACAQQGRWEATNPIDATGETALQEEKVVLFAAADPGPLAAEDSDLASRFPRDMTKYIHSLTDFVEARYSEVLPPSGSDAWLEPVGAMSGANVAVTTRVDEISQKRVLGADRITAIVTMTAYNVRGEQFWEKTATGSVLDETSPKLATEGAEPASRAAWEAARKCVYSLSTYLGALSTSDRRWSHEVEEMEELSLIDVAFDSVPQNADVYIDGIFRGTTPAIVPVPDKQVEVQIRRQGYQTWSTEMRPEVDMPIKPALEPVPGT